MKWKLVLTATALLLLTMLPMLGWPEASATASTKPLPVGSSWALKGSYRQAASSTGSNKGTYTETGDYTDKFLVVKEDSDKITLSRQEDGQWSCAATDAWPCNPKNGTWSATYQITIAVSTLTVLDVDKDTPKKWIGHPTYWMVNVGQLTEGGKVPQFWYVPDSDAKGSHASDVDFSVGTQTANTKRVQLKAWSLTYTGDDLGWYTNEDKVYSKGSLTETNLYDLAYGILVGEHFKGYYSGKCVGGAWTEDYSEDNQLEDTNLSFTVPVTLNIEPGTGAAVTVDGAKYAADQLPIVFDWVIGTTHSLQVDPTIQGGAGVQYVFVQWSDGSKDISRTLTATQISSLTATFKTQYYLAESSDVGSPQGSGWYDANTQATFSVTSPLSIEGFMSTLGGKYVFDHWSGDSTATTPTASITMDNPKTVRAEWRTDNTMPYILVGVTGLAIIAVAAIMLLMRRRNGGLLKSSHAKKGVSSLTSSSPSQVATQDTRYVGYLGRLEELKSRGGISEETYLKLKKEFWGKLEQGTG